MVFACYSAACRPPTSGGTGGSKPGGGGSGHPPAPGGSGGSGGASAPTRTGKSFDGSKRIAVGQRRSIREGDLTVTISRSRSGFTVQHQVAATEKTAKRGMPTFRAGEDRPTFGTATLKTQKEAIERANTYLERYSEAGQRQRAAAHTSGLKQARTDREAAAKANPNTPRALTRSEQRLVKSANERQLNEYLRKKKADPTIGKYTFDPSRTRLPAHVKATVALTVKQKGSIYDVNGTTVVDGLRLSA